MYLAVELYEKRPPGVGSLWVLVRFLGLLGLILVNHPGLLSLTG
jgi:hypothetical protein